MSQGISNHDIYCVAPVYFGPRTSKVKKLFYCGVTVSVAYLMMIQPHHKAGMISI